MRKCVGCEEMKDKRSLIRIVHTPDDEFLIDFKGKISGRGTYICKSIECLEAARKKKGLERSLKCNIPDNVYPSLQSQLEENEDE